MDIISTTLNSGTGSYEKLNLQFSLDGVSKWSCIRGAPSIRVALIIIYTLNVA